MLNYFHVFLGFLIVFRAILKIVEKKCTLSSEMNYIISMNKENKKLTDLHIRIEVPLIERLRKFCNSVKPKFDYSKILRKLINNFLNEKGY